MTTHCDYALIQDTSFDLNATTVLMNFTKKLPGTPASGEGAMLMWKEQRLGSPGPVNYDVSINGKSAGSFTTSAEDSHAVHEAFDQSVLVSGNNVITFTRTSSGSVRLSDVVLFYREG